MAYRKICRLGEGTFGVVYKIQEKSTGKFFALKKIIDNDEEDGISAMTIREISNLQVLRHPNIVTLADVLFNPPKISIVFEYCEYDLRKYIDKFKELPIKLIKTFLYQLLSGLSYMHKLDIVHRDLKSQNLLITNDTENILKIADFGLSRVENIAVKKYSHEAVTYWYKSPDVILGSVNYGLKVDIWSVGCIFAEMITGNVLFNGINDHEQLTKIFSMFGSPTKQNFPSLSSCPNKKIYFDSLELENILPNFEKICDETKLSRIGHQGHDLLSKMLKYDPCQRISAEEALHHPFFGDFTPSALLTLNLP
jgi:serine/threonine protein kinase